MRGFLDGFRRLRGRSVLLSGQMLFLLLFVALMLTAIRLVPHHMYVHDWNNPELNGR